VESDKRNFHCQLGQFALKHERYRENPYRSGQNQDKNNRNEAHENTKGKWLIKKRVRLGALRDLGGRRKI
jgi:hypothetical protein